MIETRFETALRLSSDPRLSVEHRAQLWRWYLISVAWRAAFWIGTVACAAMMLRVYLGAK